MGNLFNVDNAFFTFMGKVWDMICLSVVWLVLCVFCIVIVSALPQSTIIFYLGLFLQGLTIGPATTALYYSVVKVIRKERNYALRSYFNSFKLNFKVGAITSEVFMLVVFILYVDYNYANQLINEGSSMGQVFLVGCISLSLILLAMFSFIFPVLSRFTLTVPGLFKTTFLISVKHIFTSLGLIIIIGVFAIASYIFLPAIFLAPALCCLVMSFLVERVFKKYMPAATEGEEAGKDQWYLN